MFVEAEAEGVEGSTPVFCSATICVNGDVRTCGTSPHPRRFGMVEAPPALRI